MIKTTILQNFKIIFVRIKPLNTSFPVQYRYVPLSYIDNDYPYYLVEQLSSFHVLYTVQCTYSTIYVHLYRYFSVYSPSYCMQYVMRYVVLCTVSAYDIKIKIYFIQFAKIFLLCYHTDKI